MFPDKDVAWLLEKRQLIDDALDQGSQTSLGIAPGISHGFATMKEDQLRRRRAEYDYALYLLDPDVYPNPDTGKRMKITTVYRR